MGTDSTDLANLTPAALAALKLSIIIPTLNEAHTLPARFPTLAQAVNVEVIVVDGGSTDQTLAVAAAAAAQVVQTHPGRAHQMNQGAAIATGALLLFLHADTALPPEFDRLVRATLAQPGVVAGAFDLAIDHPAWPLRWVEWGVRWRSRWCQMPYGDQAIFMPTAVFKALGGFPDLPIMEDFELMRRLRRRGRVAIAPARVITSGRRWQKLGPVQTTLVNQAMILGYYLGVAPARLARWYRQQQRWR